jgi:hypothetical protein
MKRLALVVPAFVLLLAACGGSGPGPSSSSAARRTRTAPSPPGVSAPATSTAPGVSSTTRAQAGTPPCRAGELTLAFLGGQAATGHGLLGFALRNRGQVPCHTYGYPGVQFLDRAGAALPTEPTHTTHDFFGPAAAVRLTVAPGQAVSFRLGVTHGITSTAGCATAYGLQVIPPDDTATLRVAIPEGAYECRTVTVSPLQPGTTAYP